MTVNTIPMKPCESSQIAEYGYDAAAGSLAVLFRGGKKVYIFGGIDAELAAKFTDAESKGRAFGQFIKGREFTCCDPAPVAEHEGAEPD